jgi:dethiobiotin synthetase
LFITGTDTGVGKTYVATLIIRALVDEGRRVGVYKPVASGCWRDVDQLHSDDADALWSAAGNPGQVDWVCPQRFEAPLAPHLAARKEGTRVDEVLLREGIERWVNDCDIIVVEGAGGLMSPVSDEDYVADLAYEFGYPLIVVAPNVLGVINQTLQTLITSATFREGLDVAGIVLNDTREPREASHDPSILSNRQELEARCVPPLLDHLGWQAHRFTTEIDWWRLAAG